MKHILLLFFAILSFSSYAQISKMGGMASRVNDSSAYVTNATVIQAHVDGYHDIWLSNASNLWWVWNGSSYVQWDPSSSGTGGWVTTGVQTLTGPFGVESADSIGISSEDEINIRSAETIITTTSGTVSGIIYNDVINTGILGMYYINTDQGSAMNFGDRVSAWATYDAGGNTAGVELDGDNVNILADGEIRINGSPGTSGYVLQSNGAGAAPTWVAPSGGGGTPGGADTNVQYNDGGSFGGETGFTYAEGTNTLTIDNVTNGSASALTDGSTITITGSKHTLTSTQATITWTLSQTGDFQTTDIILNATSTTWTFPAGALCKVEGSATGNNVAALSGVSGDHYIMSIYKNGTDYRVAISNFGQ